MNMKRDETRKDGKLIIALSRALQKIHQRSEILFRENHITFSQFTVLEALYHKGAMSIQEIIKAVLSSSGNMTVVIRNLEKCNLIMRFTNPKDKRSFLIDLTEEGKALIENLYEQHMERVKESLQPLSEEEKEIVIEIVKKL